VDIKSGRFGLAVSMSHAVEFPAVTLIEAHMVSYEIERRNTLGSHVLDNKIQKVSGYTL
jgi:hypothetical protein